MSPTLLLLNLRCLRAASPTLALALVLMGGGCTDSTAVQRDLAAAKRLWTQTAPAAYEVTIRHDCFCPREVTRPARLTVRNGQVESRRYLDTGTDVDPRYASSFPTIDELFAIIENANARGVDRLDATYDAVYGFPVSIAIDYSFAWADDEVDYDARDFVIR